MVKEIVLGKNKDIKLVNFNQLDKSELSIVKKIAGHYINRIEKILHSYDEIKLNLKIHQRENLFIHEIKGEVFAGGKIFSATSENKNIFNALSDCFNSILRQIEREIK